MRKYRNTPQITPDGRFDSKLEYNQWLVLKLRQKAGEISGLERQKSFDLIVNGVKICRYVADFVYIERGQQIVSDAKGILTPEFKLKAKLMRAIYNITVRITT